MIIGLGLAVAASGAALVFAPAPLPDPAATVQHPPQLAHTAQSPLIAGLPARQGIGPLKGELFYSAPPAKPPPPVVTSVPAAPPPAPPSAPPMPYRFAGKVVHDGVAKVVLAKDDRVLTVEPGDRLDGGYRVDAIGADEVALVYEALGIREVLALGGANVAAPTAPAGAGGSVRPAQLRWEGPP